MTRFWQGVSHRCEHGTWREVGVLHEGEVEQFGVVPVSAKRPGQDVRTCSRHELEAGSGQVAGSIYLVRPLAVNQLRTDPVLGDVGQHPENHLVVTGGVDLCVGLQQWSQGIPGEVRREAVDVERLERAVIGEARVLHGGRVHRGDEAAPYLHYGAIHSGAVAVEEGDVASRAVDQPGKDTRIEDQVAFDEEYVTVERHPAQCERQRDHVVRLCEPRVIHESEVSVRIAGAQELFNVWRPVAGDHGSPANAQLAEGIHDPPENGRLADRKQCLVRPV